MKLLPVREYPAIANDCSCVVTDHGGAHVTSCSTTMPDGPCAFSSSSEEIAFLKSYGDWDRWVLIVLGFNDTSTLEGHFVSSPREREKRDRRDSRRDEREGQGRKRNRSESEEIEEIKTFPLYPYLLQG